nr:hypothetical protein [Candidatus Freyarchaeota archaeon]
MQILAWSSDCESIRFPPVVELNFLALYLTVFSASFAYLGSRAAHIERLGYWLICHREHLAAKKTISKAMTTSLREAMDYEMTMQAICSQTEAHRERVKAFFEKKK